VREAGGEFVRVSRLTSLAVMALLLVGCAAAPVMGPAPAGRAPDPAVLSQWVAKGRIALVAQGDGGSGSFVWQQRSERTELSFRGPLGAGGLRIMTDGDVIEMTDAAGRDLDGEAARRALEQRLGIDLPLDDMRFWMLGLPAPDAGDGTTVVLPAAANSATGFRQRDWEVSFQEFRPVGEWTLPVKFNAAAEGVRVRIVVDDWELPTP
jgi:outer membrane lipoprotein LolB